MRFLRSNPLAVLFLLFLAYQSITSGHSGTPMNWIMEKLIILPAILIGLSFHEFAHAFAADRLGDPTPKFQGRVTINPVAHVDPFGFIALIFIGFGWGRPVEVNARYFKNVRRDSLIVDFAGVTANLILAVIFTGVLKLLYFFQYDLLNTYMGGVVIDMIMAIIWINVVLMIFNLLPIPPLDGFGIVTEVFNLREKEWYYQIYNNGFLILLLLMMFHVTDKILVPAANFVFSTLWNVFF